MKTGSVKTHTQYRKLKERRRFSQIKTKMKKDVATQKTPETKRKNSMPKNFEQYNLLEIPAELACVYSKLDGKIYFQFVSKFADMNKMSFEIF